MSETETRPSRFAKAGAENARLLELRRSIRERTPKFQRQESWRYVRIHDAWRKPKGVDSHMRLSVKGWPALVKIGYRVPKKVRSLHPSGYVDVLVHNLNELEALSPKVEAARLSAGLGRRKKIELAKRAKELGIRVLNGRGLLFGTKVAEAKVSEKEEPASSEEKSKTKKKPSRFRSKNSDKKNVKSKKKK